MVRSLSGRGDLCGSGGKDPVLECRGDAHLWLHRDRSDRRDPRSDRARRVGARHWEGYDRVMGAPRAATAKAICCRCRRSAKTASASRSNSRSCRFMTGPTRWWGSRRSCAMSPPGSMSCGRCAANSPRSKRAPPQRSNKCRGQWRRGWLRRLQTVAGQDRQTPWAERTAGGDHHRRLACAAMREKADDR